MDGKRGMEGDKMESDIQSRLRADGKRIERDKVD
jgi:hypothetical protein